MLQFVTLFIPYSHGPIVTSGASVNNRVRTAAGAFLPAQERVMRSSRPILIAAAFTVIMLGLFAQAQNPPASPPGTATFTFGDGKTVNIAYSRPSVKGRTIFGGLVPYGQVWRTG